MSKSRKNAGDLTGRLAEENAAKHAAEQAERAAEMSIATAAQAEIEASGVYDPETGDLVGDNDAEDLTAGEFYEPAVEQIGAEDEVIEIAPPVTRDVASRRQEPVEVIVEEGTVIVSADDLVIIRVNEDIDQMTYGAGNHYSFAKGRKYKVPRRLARHLDQRGLVWH